MTSNGSHRVKPLRAGDPEELGDYRIRGRLGRGGMGTVYLATDANGREAALKLIHPDLSDDEAFRRRFAREVHAAQSVARFSTAAVLDAQLEGDTLYIVSEYVAGPNLAEAIAADGPMYSGTLEGLALGVAAALAAIHGAGVIHRDLKPANVLLSSVGPKVIDFGIARALDDENAVTRSSQLMGTPAYLAPELILGQDITPASDIFSWGCLVAFAGRGSAPFDAPTVPAVLHQISTAEPDLSDFDATLRTVVSQALDKDPERRPTAQQILDQLVGKENTSESDIGRTMMRSWTPPTVAATQVAAPGTPPSGQSPEGGPVAGAPGSDAATAPVRHEPTAAMPDPNRPAWNPAVASSGGYPGQGYGPSGPQSPYPPRPDGAPPPPWTGGSGPQHPAYGTGPGTQPQYGHAYGAPPPPGGPGTPGGPGSPGSPKRSKRMWFAIGGGALSLLLVLVIAVVALNSTPGPPEGVVVYTDDFANPDTGWGRGNEFDPEEEGADVGYYEDTFVLRADDREQRIGASSQYEGDELDERLMMSATFAIAEAPPQGQVGLYCYRDTSDNTAYEFLVRADGAEAQIRKLAGEGGESALADTQSVPDLGDGSEHTMTATCEEAEDGEAVQLRFWLDDTLLVEATDTNPIDLDETHGLVARRPGGGSGPETTVAFQEFSLSQLPEAD